MPEKPTHEVRPKSAETDPKREQEARKKLSQPPKDKTGVTIGPTDKSGPDVSIS